MKIAVIGDTHLGRTLYGYDLTPSIRATMYAFFRLCQQERVDVAVHLGDLFDGPRPHLALEKLAIQWCNEFERAGISLHLLVGNHDVVSKGGIASALAPLKAIDYRHIHVHEQPALIRHSGAELLFLPFPSPSLYDDHAAWFGDVQAAVNSIKLQALVFSHLNVEGAKMGEQDWVYRGGDYTLPDGLQYSDRVELVVSGHIHKQQWPSDRHLILGAAQRLRFSEVADPVEFALLGGPEVVLVTSENAVGLVCWEADASAWSAGGEAPDGNDLLTAAPDVEGMIVKVQPLVDEQTSIDWGRVEEALYADGAVFVKMLSPIFTKRKVKQQPKASVVGEPVRAAAFFIKTRVKEQDERKAIMRAFKRLQERADG